MFYIQNKIFNCCFASNSILNCNIYAQNNTNYLSFIPEEILHENMLNSRKKWHLISIIFVYIKKESNMLWSVCEPQTGFTILLIFKLFFFLQNLRQTTLTLMKKALALLQVFAITQFGCGGQEFQRNLLKRTAKANHWGWGKDTFGIFCVPFSLNLMLIYQCFNCLWHLVKN